MNGEECMRKLVFCPQLTELTGIDHKMTPDEDDELIVFLKTVHISIGILYNHEYEENFRTVQEETIWKLLNIQLLNIQLLMTHP